MRILAMDKWAMMLDWLMRCQAAGHEVRWHTLINPETVNIGRGIIARIDDPWDWWKWADLIVYSENTNWLKAIEVFRARGWPVVGATEQSAAWENDRSIGAAIFKKAGIPIIPSREFTDYDAAIGHVKKTMGRFVSKPSGSDDKALSYVAKSTRDLVYMLERWKGLGKAKTPFILQEFRGGIEMAVGGYIGPGGFTGQWCENFEFKKLMNGDMGPNTGEQGTVLRMVAKSKLADKVLMPLEEMIVQAGHVGYIDVNCIIDEAGNAWPLEFTMRFGWPTFDIQQPLIQGDPAEWLLALAEGKSDGSFRENTVSTGVVMSIPDYPYSHITKKEVTGIPVYGLEKHRDHIHPARMMLGHAPLEQNGKIVSAEMLVTAGDYVLIATGTGATVTEASRKAYRVLGSLETPNSPMWRTDIGRRLSRQLPELQAMGYATGLGY